MSCKHLLDELHTCWMSYTPAGCATHLLDEVVLIQLQEPEDYYSNGLQQQTQEQVFMESDPVYAQLSAETRNRDRHL